jgi:hypothetical protein
MLRGRLESNAHTLPDADTGAFGIIDWLAHAHTSDGIGIRIADRNYFVAELAGVVDEMRYRPISGNGLVFTLLGG